ncbi:protoporphyrinogen/coproporphyrinogen oxidase [Rhodovarius lipocyclicus]|uniref:protoporphyrinogen/coproporphyrinogen oxidase n=1 Tax=Rhodovarius lipocyclicus TaxID=268410 RepID=UPI00135CB565|nr:FAD-dependent oxidoreductase [Rhodovarius lipocyclicus]
MSNIVLGAGISGLAAAYKARGEGIPVTIYEAAERAGGLLDNFVVEGFRFDRAVHLSFATEQEVRRVFDKAPYHTHQPESVNWDQTLWLRHPVQNNMHALPAAERVELIAGLVEAPNVEINNYRDWLIHQYGLPIASRWPMVYTEKYWTVPAEELSTDWIGQRVRRADLREVLAGAFTDDTPNAFYAKEMRYPEEGGYRHFIEPMMEGADLRTGHRAVRIDADARRITFANGVEADYKALVSTLPLPRLIELMPDAPAAVREAAGSLFATQIDLISIGFNRPRVSPTLWFYIYDREILAARAYAPDWKSPANAPEGCSSLQFEIYSSVRKPQTHSVEELKRNTVEGLKRMGLADESDILFVHHTRLPYGNVVFDLGMEQRRDLVRDWVRAQGIHLAGRFGVWEYLWSNQAMLSGLNAGEAAFLHGEGAP